MDNFKNVMKVVKYLISKGYKVQRQTVYNAVNNGILERTVDGFSLAAVNRYAETMLVKIGISEGAAVPTEEQTPADWHIRKAKAQALKVELEVEELHGRLITRDRAKEIWDDATGKAEKILSSFPAKVADLIANKSAKEIQTILSGPVYDLQNELADISNGYGTAPA